MSATFWRIVATLVMRRNAHVEQGETFPLGPYLLLGWNMQPIYWQLGTLSLSYPAVPNIYSAVAFQKGLLALQ